MHPRRFPDPETAGPDGLVAVSQELTQDLLLEAYARGIFPWSEEPVRWYSPNPRAVFLPQYLRLPRRLGRMVRKGNFRVTFDTAFEEVVRGCAAAHADDGVWISDGFVRAYTKFHERGYAHSVEVWQDDKLAGGLYGVQLGGMFAGESMFYRASNASKVAFSYLVHHLYRAGVYLIDAQVLNENTANLGAVEVSRSVYLDLLAHARQLPARYSREKWPDQPSWSGVPESLPRTSA